MFFFGVIREREKIVKQKERKRRRNEVKNKRQCWELPVLFMLVLKSTVAFHQGSVEERVPARLKAINCPFNKICSCFNFTSMLTHLLVEKKNASTTIDINHISTKGVNKRVVNAIQDLCKLYEGINMIWMELHQLCQRVWISTFNTGEVLLH